MDTKMDANKDTTSLKKSPLAEALAKLDEAMHPPRGSSNDPERRRVAARLSDLVRCEDHELDAFAKRHLPGHEVGEWTMREARELVFAIGRVLGPEATSAETLGVLDELRTLLEKRMQAAKAAPPRAESPALLAPVAAVAPALLPAPAPPAYVPPPAQAVAPKEEFGGATVFGLASPFSAELPFVAATEERSAPSQRTPSPANAAPPRPMPQPSPSITLKERPPKDLGATTDAVMMSPFHTDLPFAAALAAVSETRLSGQPAQSKTTQNDPPSVPAPSVGAANPRPTSPTPQNPPAPQVQDTPTLTLQQYAGLVVACELYPSHVEGMHARYGVPTQAARLALDAFWGSRIAADPTTANRWKELCAEARKYFMQSR